MIGYKATKVDECGCVIIQNSLVNNSVGIMLIHVINHRF